MENKMTFALYFGNRGNFPAEVIDDSRNQMIEALNLNGYNYICLDKNLTKHGAVETINEGKIYAKFLQDNIDKIDGVILSLPNFGDENGAYFALKDFNKPILIQSFPDSIDKLDIKNRRDAYCGKLAICNVLRQANIPFSLTKKFAVAPNTKDFLDDLNDFAGICRVVKGLKDFSVGAIGARTTPFKTVRFDEVALQKKKITVETIDLSGLFNEMDSVSEKTLNEKINYLKTESDYSLGSPKDLENLARLSCALDKIIEEYNLSAVALRCWHDLEIKYHICPCAIMSDFVNKKIPISCELDVTNAVMMRAMQLASNQPVALFDVNNNYGDDDNKAILFHCGCTPKAFLVGKGVVSNNKLLANNDFGVKLGKVISGKVSVGSIKTENGKVGSFITSGELLDDSLGDAFFGTGAVFKKTLGTVNNMANYMALNGYKHHTVTAKGDCTYIIKEAFTKYLGFENDLI